MTLATADADTQVSATTAIEPRGKPGWLKRLREWVILAALPVALFGAYGLQRFYLNVCTKPDVQCISYKDMADWLDGQDPSVVAALQARGEASG